MKKFTKLLLSCAAVAALTAAVASSAMAEAVEIKGGEITGTYDNGALTITAPTDMKADSQATLLMYAGTETTVAADSVAAIDQAANAAFTKTGVKDAATVDAGETTYTVMLGYYNEAGTFKVLKGTLFGSNVVIGDVDLNGNITLGDATKIVNHTIDAEILTGDSLAAADTDGNGNITLGDATCIVNYTVDAETGTGNVGQK